MNPSDVGFEAVTRRRDGVTTWSKREHSYLTFWLTTHADSSAELSWELAMGEYFVAKGYTFSAQDELSLFVFPAQEISGNVTGSWLQDNVSSVIEELAALDLGRGT